jgi:phosphatidate cytidylyltransferase
VAEPNPADAGAEIRPGRGNLTLRICSALLLAPLALATAYIGGWPFTVFWAIAALGILWEWTTLVALHDRRPLLMAGGAALVLAFALAGAGRLVGAVIIIVMGTLGIAAFAPSDRRAWVSVGVPYAGAIGIAPIVLRSDHEDGFAAIVFLFAVVWATDIFAYFVGRAIGGPKLMPQVSPNKTWSGAVGGAVAGVLAALGIAAGAGFAGGWSVALLGLVLSALAQAGDLFESAFKRRFGAKDASHLIPGHGGLMDRLDGFVAAAVAGALIGIVRGGIESPARGLLVW